MTREKPRQRNSTSLPGFQEPMFFPLKVDTNQDKSTPLPNTILPKLFSSSLTEVHSEILFLPRQCYVANNNCQQPQVSQTSSYLDGDQGMRTGGAEPSLSTYLPKYLSLAPVPHGLVVVGKIWDLTSLSAPV